MPRSFYFLFFIDISKAISRVVNIEVSSIADKLSPILLKKSIDKVSPILFSKRQRITLRLLYAMSRPSVCLSVVCDVGAPYSGG